MEGAEGRIGSTLERFILWCHVYDPDSGSYHLLAFRVMQLGGLATVFVMVGGGSGFCGFAIGEEAPASDPSDQIASPGAGR